jgi:hypothetical protein
MGSKMIRSSWPVLIAVLLGLAGAQAAEVKLYKAQFRPPAELADLVGPLLAPDGTAVADDSGGFVLLRGSAEAVAQALETLARVDVQPRQYRISSELVSRSVLQARGIRVDGWVQVGDMRIGRTPVGPEGLELSAHQLRADSGRHFGATIVALENTPAEIWTGNVFPISVETFEFGRGPGQPHSGPGQRRRGGQVFETTALVPVRQGLRVRARSAGKAIELDLVPVMQDGHPGTGIREQGASTRLRISPGEQLVIGSLGRNDELRTGDPLAHAVEESASEDLMIVRVEEID